MNRRRERDKRKGQQESKGITSTEPRLTRRHMAARWEKDKRKQRAVVILGVIALLIIVSIPLYGYYKSFILPPRYTVIKVNDVKYSLGYIVRVVRMDQSFYQDLGEQFPIGTLPYDRAYTLMQNEVIRQLAPQNGLTVTEEELDQEVRNRILGTVTEGEATQEELDKEFKERYRNYLNNIDFSEKEHRRLVRMELYATKMRELKGQEVERVQPQVHWHLLVVDDASKADQALERFRAGENFAKLVEEYATDAELVRRGGDLGWTPKDVRADVDEIIFNLKAGEISEVQNLPDGTFALFMVSETTEAKEVDEGSLETLKTKALQEWVQAEIDRLLAIDKDNVYLCMGGGGGPDPEYGGPLGLSLKGCDWVYDWIAKQLVSSSRRDISS